MSAKINCGLTSAYQFLFGQGRPCPDSSKKVYYAKTNDHGRNIVQQGKTGKSNKYKYPCRYCMFKKSKHIGFGRSVIVIADAKS